MQRELSCIENPDFARFTMTGESPEEAECTMKRPIRATKPTRPDSTDRALAEQVLTNSELRYRRVFETMQDGMLILDARTGAITEVNPRLIDLLGYSREEFIDMKLWHVGAFQDTQASKDAFEVLQQNEYIRYDNLPLKAKDGRLIEVEFISTAYLVGDEKVIQCTIRDITAHKQLIAAMKENENRYRALAAHTPDGILLIALSGTILSANQAMCDELGFSEAELSSMDIWDIVPDRYLDQYTTRLAKMLNGESLHDPVEYALRAKSGMLLYVEAISAPYYGKEGVVGIQVVAHDITRRKRAEAALRESEERFRAWIEHSADMVTVIGSDGTIIYQSPSIKHLGYEPEELIGTNAFDLLHPDDRPRLLETVTRGMLEPWNTAAAEWRSAHRDGSWRVLEGVGKSVVDNNGQVVVLINSREITARKRAEEELQASQQIIEGILNAMPVRVFWKDTNLVYLGCNAAFARDAGYANPEDIIGKDDYQMGWRDQAEAYRDHDRQVIESGRAKLLIEESQTTHEGKTIALLSSQVPLHGSAGEVIGVLGTYMDITERKQAEEAHRQRLVELEVVHTVAAALRTAHSRDEALPILLDQILAALDTNAGAVWLHHPEGDALHLAIDRGLFGQMGTTPFRSGEGIAGTVFASGQTHISTELHSDPLARATTWERTPPGWGGVFLPITADSVTIGVLFVAVPFPRQLTTGQVKVLESLAGMAGTTLHRMNLFAETVRQLGQLEALHSIDTIISASTDLRVTLDILLQHVKTQLNADATCVLVLSKHSNTLEYAAGNGFRTGSARRSRIRLGESVAGRVALQRRTIQAHDPTQLEASPHFAALWADEGFAAYAGVPLIAKGLVNGVLEVYHRAPFHPKSDWMGLLGTLAGQTAIAIENAQLFQNLEQSNASLSLAYDATIEGWSRALDLRDKETEGHTLRVTDLAERLARTAGISEAEIVHIRRGALLHDIGKMGVPDSILLKPDKLTDDEWVIMRRHPQLAFDLLAPIAYLRPALDIPACHHEKWDGTGYPRGLKGEQIPPAARLFAVVDVWDALRSDRPYRAAWPEERVLEHIRSLAGTHFDPKAVNLFLQVLSEKEQEPDDPW